jgi:hypothetical protein
MLGAFLRGYADLVIRVVQASVMLAYPEPDFKGKFSMLYVAIRRGRALIYLLVSIWYGSIAAGNSIGGALALGFNAENREAGAISPGMYLFPDVKGPSSNL